MARKHKLAAALLSIGCLKAGTVWALGLGEMKLDSFLNEPLEARVPLLNTGSLHEDQIRVRLATSEDFDRLGVDRAYFLTGIKFEVRVDENGRGEIVLTSDDPVLEPYLDLIIETRWPTGRLLREYTVLVDPPAFDTTSEVISASERVEAQEGIPAPTKKKTEAAAGSGTRVDVSQKSGLGAGEMPERDFSAGTAAAPAPGSKYMIRRDQTLWQIAQSARPEGTSIHQTMLDIQRLNPDAFIDGNINRIKAGYIIYLPSADDISSGNVDQALAEVRQQNDDWRAGRASTPAASSGPSLRISADPQDSGDAGSRADQSEQGAAGAAAQGSASSAAAFEDLERAELENAELQDRLGSLSEQVQTLESIVSVKDEQIAALQEALREAGVDAGGDSAGDADSGAPGADVSEPGAEAGEGTTSAAAAETPTAPAEAASKPEPKPEPAVNTPAPEPEGSWLGSLLYPVFAVLLALIVGLFFWRRRQEQDRDEDEQELDSDRDVFAGVELREQELQVDDEPEPVLAAAVDDEDLHDDDAPAAEEEPVVSGRGYGQRKHDQYASDVDTGDVLAEADIYIAYGRYPQAIELLKNAIAAEPNNAAYRLKLLELYAQVGQDEEAAEQLELLRGMGDAQAVTRAEEVLAEARMEEEEASADDDSTVFSAPTVGNPAGATDAPITNGSPADFEAAPEFEENDSAGDDGFSELEIEDDSFDDLDDDLDLSGDFESAPEPDSDEDDDDDLVFAAEGNQMSTKLDLARAYIDMGDEAGARQILDEVVLEGSEEQRQEARALLQRID